MGTIPLKVPLISKESFYQSFNAIFGRVGRIGNENVAVELLIKKCLPTLLFVFEVCSLNKSAIRTSDYVVDSAFKKVISVIITLFQAFLKVTSQLCYFHIFKQTEHLGGQKLF